MKQLILSDIHRSLGAEFVEFAGWEMPVRYSSVMEEHMTVREAAGIFDTSHMGEFIFRGKRAAEVLQFLSSNDAMSMKVCDAQYSLFMNQRGGVLDDVFVYRTGEDDFLVVCNASNIEKLERWFNAYGNEGTDIQNISDTTVMLALQGPKSVEILQPLVSIALGGMKKRTAAWSRMCGGNVLISRSGYTGEDGFEIFVFEQREERTLLSAEILKSLLKSGEGKGLKPCGLGARDTARLEAGLCLYGNELDENTTPLEAKIAYAVCFEKRDFMGKEALLRQMEEGVRKERIGLKMLEQGAPRHEYPLLKDGREVGRVTSGTFSPILKTGIAMGYVTPGIKAGETLEVEIRGRKCRGEVSDWPFYDTRRYGYRRKA